MDTAAARIGRAAVIGAGVMGAGIAAHLANAGLPVLLLDVVPAGASPANRSILARTALERLTKADPAAFMHPRDARLIEPGNLEDDLPRVVDADWIVEAVVEDAQIKRSLYERLEAARRPGSIVSSNTSTIPLQRLTEGLPGSFTRDFLVAHFFNPPRYMRLLEVVAGPDTDPQVIAAVSAFADLRLGKGVVRVKDTPGFIANRIGSFWLQCAVGEALDAGLSIEEADAVLGRPVGVPKTGVFGLMDVVGLDLLPAVGRSLLAELPADDPYRVVHRETEIVERLIAQGYTGRKGKGGFYRLRQEAGERVKEAVDLRTGEYHTARKVRLESVTAAKAGGLRALLEHPDSGGRYAWRVLSRTLAYALSLVPAVAEGISAVDEAMRLGFGWKRGPIEMVDDLGPAWFAARLREEGLSVPPLLEQAQDLPLYAVRSGRLMQLTPAGDYALVERPPGVLLLADVKRREQPLARNASASLWNVGDGVVCLEFHSKMNTLDTDSLRMIEEAVRLVGRERDTWKGLVIHNEGDNFSVGANIGMGLFAANIGQWPAIAESVKAGQRVMRALKFAPFPVVGAPSGLALGGGCEVLLHCDALEAHAETYMGPAEAGIGLIPAWGGCKELLLRWWRRSDRPQGPMPAINGAFETVSMAKVSKSAAEARELLFLRGGDGIVMNLDRVLAAAKARVLAMAEGYQPPEPVAMRLPGPTAKAALEIAVGEHVAAGRATAHDALVASHVATVLSGGHTDLVCEVHEDELLALELEGFLALFRQPKTLARIEHMLETGRPLRN